MKLTKRLSTVWERLKSVAQKSFGHTLFLSYLAILAISLSALLLFMNMSGQQIESGTYRYSVLARSQAVTAIEQNNTELQNLMNLVNSDKLYASIAYARGPLGAYKLQKIGELREKLNSYTAFNHNIKDIYIWFSYPNVGVTTKGYVKSRETFSRSLENELGISFDDALALSQGRPFSICPVTKNSRTERLLAVINRSATTEEAIEILDLNLQSYWAPLMVSGDEDPMLWAVSRDTGLIASPVSDQAMAACFTAQELKPGAINRVVFGDTAYAVMSSGELAGFDIYSAADYSQWSRTQHDYRLLTLAYCAAYLAIGLVFSLLLTRRNARPIRQLSDMVSSGLPGPKSEGELAQLERSIHSLLRYSQDYARAMTREANRFREEALAALLRSEGSAQISAARALCEKNGISFPFEGFALAAFRIVTVERFFLGASKTSRDPDAESLTRFAVASVAGELLEKAGTAYTCQLNGQVWALISIDPSGNAMDAVSAGLMEAGNFLRGQVGIEVAAYLSRPVNGLEELNGAYREACWGLEQMESYRLEKCPCTDADIRRRLSSQQPPRPEDIATRQQELCSTVAAGDLEAGRRLYLELRCQNFSAAPASFSEIRTATAVLASYLLSELPPEAAEEHRSEIERFFSDIRAEQHERELTELMCRWMAFLHDLHSSAAGHEQQRDSLGIAEKAAIYIGENYTDMNISVASVAEQLSVSPSHLSQLFRKKYGISALEYIHQRRLDAAKLLLRESDATVESIAVQVGYSNALALIRQFRKVEDRTPTEYRRSLQAPHDEG